MLGGFEVRRRWRRVVLLAVLVGVVGAIVLSSVAGARRTSSALSRFNASSRASELELFVGDATPAQLREFRQVKNVVSFAPLRGGALSFPTAPGLQAIAQAVDTRFGTVVDRPRVIAGRLARSTAVDEANVGEALATQLHIGVGDHLDGESYTPAQVDQCLTGGCNQATVPAGPRIRLRIVGIVRRPLDLGDRGAAGGVLVLTPAFNRKYENRIGTFNGTILRVRARNGAADVGQIAAAARRIFGKSPEFGVQDLAVDTQGAQNAIDVLVVALWTFAGVTALAGLVAITIVLSREISLSTTDQTTERALGLTRLQNVAIGGLQALPIALVGALIAVVGAAFASRMFPIGVARRAEPDLGLHLDWTVLALGTAAIVSGILLLAFLAAFRTTRRQGRGEFVKHGQTARAIDAASRAGVRPVATTGVRMALEPGRGSATVPVRSAIFGGVFGVLGVVAVFLFASSLDHIVATPASYGWTWNFAATVDSPSVVARQTPLADVPGVAAVAKVLTANLQLDGRPVIVWGFTSLRGTLGPQVVAGREPRSPNEIALGASSLDELGKSIGDTVRGDGPDGSHRYRIVGRGVFPKLDSAQPLANGAALTGAGFARLLSPTNLNIGTVYAAVRDSPSADPATVEHRVANIADVGRPFGPTVPVEVDRLRQVNWLPVTLAGLLSLLALLAVGHALVTSVRRRRRDLAVLKTLGFDRGQIRATIAWQATTLALVGLIIGIPAGILVGSFVWRQVATGLGIATTPQIPVLALLLTIPAALVAVNLIAYAPARAAARTRPAVALRSE
jgi:ABC-type antimicrobial peptide transport system permease subunit